MKLKRVLRFDSIKLDDTYFTDEGYLIDHPIVTSCGIFEYSNPDGSIRRELRLPEHVFSQESLDSYEGKPVIITHSAGEVDKDNVDQEIIGTILSKGYRDGDDVRAKIIIHDTDAMQESGLRELSLGYGLVLDETPGIWDGEPYDAIQTKIDINHLALVANARAGEQARLNIDGRDFKTILKGVKKIMKKGKKSKRRNDCGPMSPEELKEVVEAYKDRRDQRLTDCSQEDEDTTNDNAGENPNADNETNAADMIQMVKDRRDRRDQEGDPDIIEEALGVIAQQDEDIDTLLEVVEILEAQSDFDEAENSDEDNEDEDNEDENEDEDNEDENENEDEENEDESQAQAGSLNADSVDRLVRTRVNILRVGDKLNLDGLDTMSITQAKKAIIKKVKPKMRLDGKGKAYLNAAFDLAVDEVNSRKDTNYQRRQMFNADGMREAPSGKTAAERAREKMITKLNGGKK